jgi:hypothetical protein
MIRFLVSCCLVVVCGTTALAQPPKPIPLLLTPAKPPTPALRYQLLPDIRLTTTGNAADIYKQVAELLAKHVFNQDAELFDGWSKAPVERLPKEAMRKKLAEYDDVYELLDKAAGCEHCDWGIRDRLREKGIGALLPEIQPMRNCALLLSVRVRWEMAEGRFDKAVNTLRTGFALAKHTGDSEVLIGFLVGVAIAGIMEGQLDQFVARPDAPNLYYALTDLPASLISMRKGLQGERLGAYGTFPGLAAVSADLNAGNLSEMDLKAFSKLIDGLSDDRLSYLGRILMARHILQKHEVAKQALVDAGRPRDKVEAMPHLQVAVLHALLEYDAALDNMIVWQNLPYWEQADHIAALDRRTSLERMRDPNAAAIPLAPLLIPAVQKVSFAKTRIERKLALLRTIEALRFYAATHEGKLPPSLAAVKEVPLPLDPATGKNFDYKLDGDTATLTAPVPPKQTPHGSNTVVYQLRIRK